MYLATADGYRKDFMKIGFTMRHTDMRMTELDKSSGQGTKGYNVLARFYIKNPKQFEKNYTVTLPQIGKILEESGSII
ncbi:hypothetical protein [Pseudoalteromonas issachenkonii]|uniref:hypothetical protein n=1 Tax=Pseudoalteromonas issachenkonii TaxID=152297 RepID=UPI003CC9EEF5